MGHSKRRRDIIAWVSDLNDQIVAASRRAGQALDIRPGQTCGDALSDGRAVRAPCVERCGATLRQAGCGAGVATEVGIDGRIFTLSCVPTAEGVVSTLIGGEPEGATWQKLTVREIDMLYGLADGLTTDQIALEYGVSSATVRTHIEHMRVKFDVSTRAGLVAHGYRRGYLS